MKSKKEEIYKDKALSYIDNVMSGKRKAGELERLAVERHVRDLKQAAEMGLYFDEKAAKKVLGFCQFLRLQGRMGRTGICAGRLAMLYLMGCVRMEDKERCPTV